MANRNLELPPSMAGSSASPPGQSSALLALSRMKLPSPPKSRLAAAIARKQKVPRGNSKGFLP